MIVINRINKKYSENSGNFNINLQVPEGSCYGIVGPNGSGKTTLIRQILGFIKPDSGSITIDDIDSWKKREKIMEITGYIAGEISLYNEFTGNGFLKLQSKIHGNVEWSYVENLIKHFDIDTKVKIKKMSKGMKQKIAIISAVMNRPKILILDEPTSGLDPTMQRQFNVLMQKLKSDNKTTIIICSHIFEEVSELADKVGFIKNGKLIEEQKVVINDLVRLKKRFSELFERESFI